MNNLETMKRYLYYLVLLLSVSTELKAQAYQGIVCDSINHQPLQYALVSLCDANNKSLCTGITDSIGAFNFSTVKGIRKLKVSLSGYANYTKELTSNNTLRDTLFLAPLSEVLGEVVVNASKIMHGIDKDTYLITDSLRRNTSIAAEMLDKIHGIRFDKFHNTLKVNGSEDILLLVNGIKKSAEYIKNLDPTRIEKLEVIHDPSGQYASGEYSAILNFILKEDYKGWDVLLDQGCTINTTGTNGKNWFADETPEADFTYTYNKWTVNAQYSADINKQNQTKTNETTYTGIQQQITDPMDIYNTNWHRKKYLQNASVGVDYEITKNHIISLQNSYSYADKRVNSQYSIWNTNLRTGSVARTTQINNNTDYSNDYSAGLFYRGNIGDKWELHGDLEYNYYAVNSSNFYGSGNSYSSTNNYRSFKNYTFFNADAIYSFTKKLSLSFGYINIWKEYVSKDAAENEVVSKSRQYRNRGYVFLSYIVNEKFSIKAGTGMEWIRDCNLLQSKNHFSLLPSFRLHYLPYKWMNLNMEYYTLIDYPTLDEISSRSYFTDSLMMVKGNPLLKHSLRHRLDFKASFWNRLTVSMTGASINNFITSFYSQEENKVLNSYTNADYKFYFLTIDYDQPLCKNLRLKSELGNFGFFMKGQGLKNDKTTWRVEESLQYENESWGFNAALNYDRELYRKIQLQGSYVDGGDDLWYLSLNKNFLKNRLSVMVMYALPITWGVRVNYLGQETTTDFYKTSSIMPTYKTIKNVVLINLSYRFVHGKKTRAQENSMSKDKE